MPDSSLFSKNVAAVFLGVLLLVIAVSATLLELDGATTPDLLEILGGAAVGALAALVAQPQ